MYQFKNIDDVIAAIATSPGTAGIGIVRLCGAGAIDIAQKFIQLKSKKLLSAYASHQICYGWIVDCEDIVDEVLVTIMRAPTSYTTQDTVEINCHGGIMAVRAVLQLCLSHGARLAEPGEFTKRAFLLGRLDLAQAEAVLDIINAKTNAFLRVSSNQLSGELSAELNAMREELMSVYTTIEAIINFPEDDIDAQGRAEIKSRLTKDAKAIDDLLMTSNQGRLLKEGIRIVLCGKPNVGKSSLLNALLKQQRAIVTDVAGTTRDVLEESMNIQGMPLQLVDTAGILEPRDLVEEEAIKRSHLYIDSADLVLLVIDSSRALEDEDRILCEKLKDRNVLVVFNKSDLTSVINAQDIPFKHHVRVSAKTNASIHDLEQAIVNVVTQGHHIDPHALVISNLRHIDALQQAHRYLTESITLIDRNGVWEIVSDNIKNTVNGLDAITGRNIDTDLVDRIFSEFCIGK